MTLNEKLAELRKARGLTQQEIAEALDVSRQAVSRWEVGTATPTLDNLSSLSRLYGVPLDYFIQKEAGAKLQETVSADVPPAVPVKSGRSYVAPVCSFLAVLILGVGILIGLNLRQEPEAVERPVPGSSIFKDKTPTDLQKELEKALDAFVEKGTRVEPLGEEELEGLQFQDSYAYLVIPGDVPGEEKYERCIITSEGAIVKEGTIVEEINEEYFFP